MLNFGYWHQRADKRRQLSTQGKAGDTRPIVMACNNRPSWRVPCWMRNWIARRCDGACVAAAVMTTCDDGSCIVSLTRSRSLWWSKARLEDPQVSVGEEVCGNGMWYFFPSVLWHCWLGDTKGIRPVETWVVVCWWLWFDWSFTRPIAPALPASSLASM